MVSVGSACIAAEAVVVGAPIDPGVKLAVVTLLGAIGAAAFAVKEALGSKTPTASTPSTPTK
jgi:hypothetical protein